jgi:hypothetical protein
VSEQTVARRRFLRIGATSVGAAAVLAACGAGDDAETAVEPTTTTAKPSPADVTVLRTASSLELAAVALYDQAIKSGLVTSPGGTERVRTFMAQHKDHAAVFEGLTKKLGGQPYSEPNPAIVQQFQPRLAALTAEHDVMMLALELERAAIASYLSYVGTFADRSLNEAVMSVAGVQARHAALLAAGANQPAFPGAFATTEGAIAPGTGL